MKRALLFLAGAILFSVLGATLQPPSVTGNGNNTLSGSNTFSGVLQSVIHTNSGALQTASLYTTSTSVLAAVMYKTNLVPVACAPDFNVPVALFSTNNVVVFQAPTNVDASGTLYQSVIVFVTNTTPATPRAILAPANCHTNLNGTGLGTCFVTNLTRLTFEQYGGKFTNMLWQAEF